MISIEKFKYKNIHKKHLKGVLPFKFKGKKSIWALQALSGNWMLSNQWDSFKASVNNYLKKQVKLIYYVTPTRYVTKKPKESRMGSGKGKITSIWESRIMKGKTLMEIETSCNFDKYVITRSLSKSSFKLPFKVLIVKKL